MNKTVSDKHLIRIAKHTLKTGGITKAEARQILRRFCVKFEEGVTLNVKLTFKCKNGRQEEVVRRTFTELPASSIADKLFGLISAPELTVVDIREGHE